MKTNAAVYYYGVAILSACITGFSQVVTRVDLDEQQFFYGTNITALETAIEESNYGDRISVPSGIFDIVSIPAGV